MRGAMDGFYIGESGIYARLFRPYGTAACPLVVVFHGFPGNEQNSDIAYALRESGYAVLAPYYRGCWGSKGDYRIETIPDDIRTVLDLARSAAWTAERGIDPTRLGVIGHSLGGWAALISPRIATGLRAVVALDPVVEPGLEPGDPEAAAGFRKWLDENRRPLNNVTVDELIAGFRLAAQYWHPLAATGHLAETALAVICASGNDALPLEPALSLMRDVRSAGGAQRTAEFWVLDSDHSFVSRRPLLRDLVVQFIKRHV